MPETRIHEIEKRLTDAFSPTRLEIIDESHKHAGHAGAASGGGHFIVTIASPSFNGLPMVKQHRMVFAALDDMMESEIHALKINIA